LRDNLLLYRKRMLQRLKTVGDDLSQASADIPAEKWHTPAADGETPHLILARQRAVEAQVFSVRLRRILDEEVPNLPLFVEEAWMAEHYDPSEPPEEVLAEYNDLRSQELAWLKSASPQDWNRTGRHPWWGIRSLQWWVEQALRYSEEQLRRLQEGGRA
jgi:hypothetical protein